MLIQKLIVHNIRSYTHQEVTFPRGFVLLSGDIGSGKSSLLLAIEFAIFGILRGTLEGNSLLRHGEQEGYVELTCTINSQEITIRRTLKRTKTGITQESGHIITKGIKEAATAVELKSKMLDLLGYPADLLTKNKSLIFRYTVYTPQEQMKAILFEDADERLNTLRKVFDIDKYKRVKENALVYARMLRERKKRLEGELVDFDKKVKQYDAIKSQKTEADEKVRKIRPQLTVIEQERTAQESILKTVEKAMQELTEFKKQVQITETTIKYEMQRKMDAEEELKRATTQLSVLKEEFTKQEPPDHNTITQSLKDTQKRVQQVAKERELASRQISELGVRISHAMEIKQKLQKLDECPLCLQNVTKDHKQNVVEREDVKVREYTTTQTILTNKMSEWEKQLKQLQGDIEHLYLREREAAVFTVKQAAVREKEQSIQTLRERSELSKVKIEQSQTLKRQLNEECFKRENAEHEYKKVRTALDSLQKQERDLSIRLASASKEQETITTILKTLAQEIAAKEIAKKKLERINAISHWLGDYFTRLVDVIEKHVLLSVYQQFNGLFQQWFGVLMEDDTMSARLDDSFAPVIEQNGYETDLQSLSGGEKTSCALAYRLALNKVINALISTIHTRDIIILDEPTEGFSREQLDRVREVLNQLQVAQAIIVSHEAKMESFVDTIIRVTKEQHESVVAQEA